MTRTVQLRCEPTNAVASVMPSARRLGGVISVASGFALIAAPRATGQIYGLPDTAVLCRTLGARDVLIGLGLLGSRRWLAWWWLGRTASDAFDVGLIIRHLRGVGKNGPADVVRTMIGLALVGIDLFMTLIAIRTPLPAGENQVTSPKMW
jgi:hypothetical protein